MTAGEKGVRAVREKTIQPRRTNRGLRLLLLAGLGGMVFMGWQFRSSPRLWTFIHRYGEIAPLAMQGGDPYVRALMRTISASEANDPSPYTILYGGQHFDDLSQHPDRCLPITEGPNLGNCTTAAGRYQFLFTTWLEKAKFYHPRPSGLWLWQSYSFEPQYQDQVVYAWLRDRQAWGVDIPKLLRQGQLDPVLKTLSGTWTSLGYGIEDNLVTPSLTKIYRQMLTEEKAKVGPAPRSKIGQGPS
jgi:muramidase (phage lysozyme)